MKKKEVNFMLDMISSHGQGIYACHTCGKK